MRKTAFGEGITAFEKFTQQYRVEDHGFIKCLKLTTKKNKKTPPNIGSVTGFNWHVFLVLLCIWLAFHELITGHSSIGVC